jgi:hypothetical protein
MRIDPQNHVPAKPMRKDDEELALLSRLIWCKIQPLAVFLFENHHVKYDFLNKFQRYLRP